MKLRFGVVGAGWVASDRHLPNLVRNPDVDVVGVFDHHLEKAASRAPDGAIATDDLDELFSLSLDAVAVCSPPWLHAEHTLAALERGVHVLCEKPLGLSLAEARSMFDAADDANRLLCPVHNFLWSRSFVAARNAIGSAETLHLVATQLSSDARRLPDWTSRIEGGLLFDEIPHILYVLEALGDGELVVEDVRAIWGGRQHEPQSCDVRVRAGSVGASLTIVFGAPISEWHVSAVTERSVVDIDLFRDVALSTGSDGAHTAARVLGLSARVAGAHFAGFARSGVAHLRRRQHWGHDRLIDAFVAAVKANDPLPPVSRASALSVVAATARVLEGIQR